jgi:hypothetical protein
MIATKMDFKPRGDRALDTRSRKTLTLIKDPVPSNTSDVTLASEAILAKDWLSPEEDKTWEHL